MFLQQGTKCHVFKQYLKQILFIRSCSTVVAPISTTKSKINQPSYFHHVGTQPLIYKTIGHLLSDAAEEYPDRECLVSVHEKKRYTFRQMNEKVDQLASGFISSGLKQGDRIGIWSPNYVFWYMTMMAAAKAGLIMVGINPGLQTEELEYCINKVGMKALVAPEAYKTQNYYNMLKKLAPELEGSASGSLKSSRLPSLSTIVVVSDDNDFRGAYTLNDIFSLATNSSNDELMKLNKTIQPDNTWAIFYSSGTTGKPKAVMLSHSGFFNTIEIMSRRFKLQDKRHRFCLQVPFFHGLGIGVSMYGLLNKSALVLAGPTFAAECSLKAIEEEKCTAIVGVPAMFVDLVAKQKELNYCLDSVDFSFCAGATVTPQLYKQMKETLNVKKTLSGYGLSESGGFLTSSFIDDSDDLLLNTVGHVLDHVEVKVVDEAGHVVPLGTPGELCVRYYGTMLGYWGEKEKTAEVLGADKWLRTGDRFILDANGYGRVVGRIKDMIIRGGENISPKEIEDFISTHPDVLEAHVVAAPDERMGEEICAFVKVCEGTQFNHETLKSFCRLRIAHFKIPKYLEIVTSFPKTATGKVQKFRLREIIKEKLNKQL